MQVVCIGDLNIDVSGVFPYYPRAGGEAHTSRFDVRMGGAAANAAAALGRLDFEVELVARVGNDQNAHFALESLRACGVGTTYIQHDPDLPTGQIFVVAAGGERTMFGARGANANLDPDQIPVALLKSARLCHVSGYSLMSPQSREAVIKSVDIARRSGCLVSLDPGVVASHEARCQILEILPMVDILLPNEREICSLAGTEDVGEALRELTSKDRGPWMCVVKRGRNGALVSRKGGEMFEIPAFEFSGGNTTGAGDVFDAGFIAGVLADLGPLECGTLGNSAAVLYLRRRDLGRLACPDLGELRDFLGQRAAIERPELRSIVRKLFEAL